MIGGVLTKIYVFGVRIWMFLKAVRNIYVFGGQILLVWQVLTESYVFRVPIVLLGQVLVDPNCFAAILSLDCLTFSESSLSNLSGESSCFW
jgi:hypothetical protein